MGEALRFAPVVARRHWRLATIHPGRGKMNQSERRKYLIQSLMDEDGLYLWQGNLQPPAVGPLKNVLLKVFEDGLVCRDAFGSFRLQDVEDMP